MVTPKNHTSLIRKVMETVDYDSSRFRNDFFKPYGGTMGIQNINTHFDILLDIYERFEKVMKSVISDRSHIILKMVGDDLPKKRYKTSKDQLVLIETIRLLMQEDGVSDMYEFLPDIPGEFELVHKNVLKRYAKYINGLDDSGQPYVRTEYNHIGRKKLQERK